MTSPPVYITSPGTVILVFDPEQARRKCGLIEHLLPFAHLYAKVNRDGGGVTVNKHRDGPQGAARAVVIGEGPIPPPFTEEWDATAQQVEAYRRQAIQSGEAVMVCLQKAQEAGHTVIHDSIIVTNPPRPVFYVYEDRSAVDSQREFPRKLITMETHLDWLARADVVIETQEGNWKVMKTWKGAPGSYGQQDSLPAYMQTVSEGFAIAKTMESISVPLGFFPDGPPLELPEVHHEKEATERHFYRHGLAAMQALLMMMPVDWQNQPRPDESPLSRRAWDVLQLAIHMEYDDTGSAETEELDRLSTYYGLRTSYDSYAQQALEIVLAMAHSLRPREIYDAISGVSLPEETVEPGTTLVARLLKEVETLRGRPDGKLVTLLDLEAARRRWHGMGLVIPPGHEEERVRFDRCVADTNAIRHPWWLWKIAARLPEIAESANPNG